MLTTAAEPERVTAAQMDRWARDFDNWASGTRSASTSDRTPLAWRKVGQGSRARVRQARASLLASPRAPANGPRTTVPPLLRIIERGAEDERNLVKKAVSWRCASRPSEPGAERAATRRATPGGILRARRWVGRITRELTSPAVRRRLATRAARR
jgi:hypothetical protein